MDTQTIVNVILCVLSFVLAAISTVTVVITLRQNSKMIENISKPYIAIYGATANFQNMKYYLVIKNFGQSGAYITSLECNINLQEYSFAPECIPFEHISNSFIAPSQSFICELDQVKLFNQEKHIHFSITYKNLNKTYTDDFLINLPAYLDLIQTRANTQGKELKIISYTLQDLVEKLL